MLRTLRVLKYRSKSIVATSAASRICRNYSYKFPVGLLDILCVACKCIMFTVQASVRSYGQELIPESNGYSSAGIAYRDFY
jgi:hypothetical protein